MLKFINDPIPFVIKAFKELYPGLDADLQFNPDIEACGCTTIPDDGQLPLIDISTNLSISALPEILAHELAHVAKPNDEHGEEWKQAFDSIFMRAQELSDQAHDAFNSVKLASACQFEKREGEIQVDEKEWYKSKTVWGGLIAVGAAVASAFGITIDADAQNQLADYIVVAVGAIGGLIAIYGRVKAGKTIK